MNKFLFQQLLKDSLFHDNTSTNNQNDHLNNSKVDSTDRVIEELKEIDSSFFKICNYDKTLERLNKISESYNEQNINKYCLLSIKINKIICKLLNNESNNISSLSHKEEDSSLEGVLSQLKRELSNELLIKNNNYNKYLLFGMKSYLITLTNQITLMKTKEYKQIIEILTDGFTLILQLLFTKFLKIENKEINQFENIQEAIQSNFSGLLFFEKEKKKRKLKKKKKIISFLFYFEQLKSFLNKLEDKDVLSDLFSFHLEFCKTLNLLCINYILRKKYKKVLKLIYFKDSNQNLIEEIFNLWFINDEFKTQIDECINDSELYLSICLYKQNDINNSLFHCKNSCNRGYLPSLYFSSLILFEKEEFIKSKESFLKLIEILEKKELFNYLDYCSEIQLKSMNYIAMIYAKEGNFVESLNWFKKSLHFVKSNFNQSSEKLIVMKERVKSMYFAATLNGIIGNLMEKRNLLIELYRILTNKDEMKNKVKISPVLVFYQLSCCMIKEEKYIEASECLNYLLQVIITGMDKEKCWGNIETSDFDDNNDELVSLSKILISYIYCLLQTHNYEMALSYCNFLLNNDVKDKTTVVLYKCDALLCLERPITECEECLEKVLKQDEELLSFHRCILYNNKAMLLICKKEITQAQQLLKKAISLFKRSTSLDSKLLSDISLCITFNLTLTCIELNQLEDAKTWWFSLRNIPLDSERDYYITLYKTIQQQFNFEITDNIAMSAVTGKVSSEQQTKLDIFLLYLLINKEK
ncbi:hypothetical protein ABK040_014124 [Willaertia magna]